MRRLTIALTIVLTTFVNLVVISNSYAGMQEKRKQFIQKMVNNNIFQKVERDGKHPTVWVGPVFYGLSYQDKSSFINVVYAYFVTQNKKYNYVTLMDGRSGKIVGGYSEKIGGLQMN